MPNRTPPAPVASARGRVASLSRSRSVDDPALVDARRELRAARLEEHIRRVVAEAPPFTPEQRARLAILLRPSPIATTDTIGRTW